MDTSSSGMICVLLGTEASCGNSEMSEHPEQENSASCSHPNDPYEDSVSAVLKRNRGRPRKARVAETTEEKETSLFQDKATTKPGRGRPRKTPEEKALARALRQQTALPTVNETCSLCSYSAGRTSKAEKRTIYPFPKSVGCRSKWTEICRQFQPEFTPSEHAYICELHFMQEDFGAECQLKKTEKAVFNLKKSAVPSRYLHSSQEYFETGLPCSSADEQSERAAPSMPQILVAEEKATICDGIYCEDCAEFSHEPCWLHTTYVHNTPVVPFALASLPESLIIDLCQDSGEKGVFTKYELSPQTVFGPMVGALCSSKTIRLSPFGLKDPDYGIFKQFHMGSDDCCNWMRYVRFAENKKEQNLMACVKDDEIVFVVTKDVRPGQELKIWYSRNYAEMLSEVGYRGDCLDVVLNSRAGPMESMAFCDTESGFRTERAKEQVEFRPSGIRVKSAAADYPYIMDETAALAENADQNIVQTELNVDKEGLKNVSVPNGVPPRRSTRFRSRTPSTISRTPALINSKEKSVLVDEDEEMPPLTEFRTVKDKLTSVHHTEGPSGYSTEKGQRKLSGRAIKRLAKKDPSAVIKFPCADCGVHFPSEATLTLHLTQHSITFDGIERKCPECGSVFEEFDELIRHVKVHSRRYLQREKCPHCGDFAGHIKRHIRLVHPDKYDDNLPKQHRIRRFQRQALENPAVSVRFPCNECMLQFPSKRMHILHNAQHSGDVHGVERECPECGVIFQEFDELVQHTSTHGKHFEHRQKCAYCECFVVPRVMNHHVRLVHPERYRGGEDLGTFPCEICGQECRTADRLRLHHNSKHKMPQCLFCAKIESSWHTLGLHVQSHREADGYHCRECPSVFKIYNRLTTHHRNHHDITSICSCSICGKTFGSSYKLGRHMLHHAQRYEHKCDLCGKGFCTYNLLRYHKRYVHEPGEKEKFQLRYQEKKRTGQRKNYVNPRKRMVYEEFPFKCEVCREGFLVMGKLVRHQQRLHAADSVTAQRTDGASFMI